MSNKLKIYQPAVIDTDGKQRRSLLATSNLQGEWKFSFTLKLAETYLKTKNIYLENVNCDPYGMRFNATKLPQLQPKLGRYSNPESYVRKCLTHKCSFKHSLMT
ncbi:MAG: hypothetical protein V7L23_24850 [Nostoc sp.]|uniref:hypothetical protein n=1 Tax=Nostoc sp. TaxID=1180 RepID=UPI002FF1A182